MNMKKMDNVILSKYNTAARICGSTYQLLKDNILKKNINNIKQLYDMGMQHITKECNSCYKNISRKGVAYPISISLNNQIDHYTYNPLNPDLCIKDNDIVKIKLGVDIDGCIAMYSNTFINNNENHEDDYIKFLNKLKDEIVKQMYSGNTNDEIRIYIESKCTDHKCFPITNCKSYEHLDNQIYNENGNYMILNYKKLYDRDEYLIHDNDCLELSENEVYTIHLLVVPDQPNDDDSKIYCNDDQSLLYRFNDCYVGLKLKASHALYSTVTKNHDLNVFNIHEYLKDTKLKLGVKECLNTGILEKLPACCMKNTKENVYSLSFTVCIRNKDALMLKYF